MILFGVIGRQRKIVCVVLACIWRSRPCYLFFFNSYLFGSVIYEAQLKLILSISYGLVYV
ncbi:hypothetical protein RchiOBHm_Chr2g0135681 [Rosa chinensis]|uniref:Uncharacterized protein n=1 Tax=Rosa chinensis TaxID=74649 RepID=A0A2P6RW54_ROSCH|nr:hypothetical protein RchiOBHm_Chr2g0135681 [Rosa chinensis]